MEKFLNKILFLKNKKRKKISFDKYFIKKKTKKLLNTKNYKKNKIIIKQM
jgi:hypothetical protein